MKLNLKIVLGLSLLNFTVAGAMAFEGERSGANELFNNATMNESVLSESDIVIPIAKMESRSILSSITDYFDLNKRVHSTKFSILASLFNKGTTPDIEDVTGWFSGRWFSIEKPNEARGALFIGKYSEKISESGPLFTKRSLNVLFSDSGPANYYDNLSPEQVKKMRGYRKIPAKFKNGELSFSKNSFGEHNYQVRKYDKYLIIKHTRSASYFDLNKYVSYTYLFKNVTPEFASE